MLTAIQLDDDSGIQTYEVTDVRTDRVLPSELEVVQLSSTQMPPKEAFGVGRILAQAAGKSDHAPSRQQKAGANVTTNTTYDCFQLDPSAPSGHLPLLRKGRTLILLLPTQWGGGA